MKYLRFGLIATTISLASANGAIFFASSQVQPIKSAVVTTTTAETTAPAPVAATTTAEQPPVAAPATTEPVTSAPAPAPSPVYRTFDQIIADYPNMSGTKLNLDCSHQIEQAFPYRFTDEKRETNVKLLASTFVSSCAAAYRGGLPSSDPAVDALRPMVYLRDMGQGDWWAQHGGL